MADKRIWELTTSTVKTGKYLAMDSSGQAAAHKFLMTDLVDTISVQTITAAKRFSAPVEFVDANSWITRDGSNNLIFNDAVLGTKTLSELYGTPLTIGTSGQIPYVNGAGDDFLYAAALNYTTGVLNADGGIQVTSLSSGTDSLVYAEGGGSGRFRTSSKLYFDGSKLTNEGDLTMQGLLRVDGAATIDYFTFRTNNSNINGRAVFAIGNVGPPDVALWVMPDQAAQFSSTFECFTSNDNTTTLTKRIGLQSTTTYALMFSSSKGGSDAGVEIRFTTLGRSGTTQMRLATSGNFAIGSHTPTAKLHVVGTAIIDGLPSDDTEDHVVAIDDATGVMSKRAVSTILPSLGTAGQVPYMNPGATNFTYGGITMNAGTLEVPGGVTITSLSSSSDSIVMAGGGGTGDLKTSANLYYTGGILVLNASQLDVDHTSTDIADFKSTNATFSRIVVDAEATADSQIAFQRSNSTKWSVGNDATGDAFVISLGFGAFGGSDFFKIFTTGVVQVLGSFKLLAGATVDDIETVLTNDDTHLPTSGAVFDAIAASGVSLGSTTQIPYMNGTGTDFLYSANLTFDGTTFETNELALSSGTTVDTIETTLTNDNDHIPTSGAVFSALPTVYWASDANGINYQSGRVGIGQDSFATTTLAITMATTDVRGIGIITTDTTPVIWSDFPSSLPQTTMNFNNDATVAGSGMFTALGLGARGIGTGAANAWVILAGQTLSTVNHSSSFNVLLRGPGVSDYVTVFKAQTGPVFYWQSETTAQDITHFFRQGTSDRAVFGYDDSTDDFTFCLKQTGGVTYDDYHCKFRLTQYSAYVEGYQNGGLYVVAGTDITSRTASIQLIGSSAGDSLIAFRQATGGVNAFVIGYDDSNDCFQINDDSTAFTSLTGSVLSIVRGSAGAWYMDLEQVTTSTNYTRWNSADNRFGWLSSDKRLKKNIRNFEDDALKILSSFKPKRFQWKDGGSEEVGWIAQEGLKHLPAMFPVGKHGLYSLNEFAIFPVYHKAIQQLLARIEELESKINA